MTTQDWAEAALTLPAAERLVLAQQLLDSVIAEAMPLTPAELAEIHRRATELDGGRVACESWESVRTRLTRAD